MKKLIAPLVTALALLGAAPAAQAHYPTNDQAMRVAYNHENWRCGNGWDYFCVDRRVSLYVMFKVGDHSKVVYYSWRENGLHLRTCDIAVRVQMRHDGSGSAFVAEVWDGERCW